jgi:hypothetical protein
MLTTHSIDQVARHVSSRSQVDLQDVQNMSMASVATLSALIDSGASLVLSCGGGGGGGGGVCDPDRLVIREFSCVS